MKKVMMALVACSAFALSALASGAPQNDAKSIQPPKESQPAQDKEQIGPSESVFDRAWESVALGARKTAKAGDWLIERTKDGAVVAYRSAEKVGKVAAQEADEAAILSVIKARLVADPATSARISVDVQKGTVTLKGDVRSADEARAAIRLARQTSGVNRVVSHLRWPGMAAPR